MQYSNIAPFYQKIMIRNDFLVDQVRVFDSKDRIFVSINYKHFGEFKRDGYSSEFNDDFEEAYQYLLKFVLKTLAKTLGFEPDTLTLKDVLLYQIVQY